MRKDINSRLKEQKRTYIAFIVVGVVIWVIFSLTSVPDFEGGIMCGFGSALALLGVISLIKNHRLYADPEKAAEFEASLNDERMKYITDRARSLTFIITVYAELIASLFCAFVLHEKVLNMVFAYTACAQCLIYIVARYWMERKY